MAILILKSRLIMYDYSVTPNDPRSHEKERPRHMDVNIDRDPYIRWDDTWQKNMTRCIACGLEWFFHIPERRWPHLCVDCADAAGRHPDNLLHSAAIAYDQGPRQVHADAAAVYRDPSTGRQGFCVTDGIGDDYEPATAAYTAAWSAAAAAATGGAAAGLHTARTIWHRHYDHAPAGQEGNALAVVAAPIDTANGGGFDIAWCGDARAYAYEAATLTQITTDHTEAQHMRDTGMPAQWIGPRAENTVRASVGRGDIASVRILDPVGRLLLCSDGVHRQLSPDAMTRILRVHESPRNAATRLIRAARQAGSTDNATALVIDLPASANSRYHRPNADSH
ncbi:hypothetical protein [Micromonospora sp. NPDC049204]|uniref:PP2C family protein-serine/threonine phosphatase n=1 Tax=Micromonospora sp. NPDC049204 TaxID=3154351 RepID=UPI0033DA2B18